MGDRIIALEDGVEGKVIQLVGLYKANEPKLVQNVTEVIKFKRLVFEREKTTECRECKKGSRKLYMKKKRIQNCKEKKRKKKNKKNWKCNA